MIFNGAATAIITPFRDGEIDFDALRRITEMQIEAGTDAIVALGTTGEASTLKDVERERLYSFFGEYVWGRVKLIYGVGANDTDETLRRISVANKYKCDGLLVVTPYYNKGTREGIKRHFALCQERSEVPVILYNVPSRTGVDLTEEQIDYLISVGNVGGIKEASDSANKLVNRASLCDKIPLYAGNDTQIYTVLSLGGGGVISVVSNIFPSAVSELCRAYFRGETEEARRLQFSLLPLIDACFCETNPAPVKYALSSLGLCKNELRLPMGCVCPESERIIDGALGAFGKEYGG